MKSFKKLEEELAASQKVTDEVLYDGKWVQLKLLDGWYEYLHNKGDGVLVLAVDKLQGRFLCRYENCPVHGDPHSLDPTSLTGTVEEGDTPVETSVKEMLEESGYVIKEEELKYQGIAYSSKASDNILHLFYIEMNGEADDDIHEGEGDGSKGENGSYCRWLPIDQIANLTSPSVALTAVRAGIFIQQSSPDRAY